MHEEDWGEEDWDDDGDYDPEEEGTASCPECGAEIQLILEQCPECGYWLTEADRRRIDGPKYRSEGLSLMAWVVAGVVALGLVFAAVMAVLS
ncbi:MAG: hypothetical protein AAGA92_01365 [Planctomycetota bacterium]